MKYVAAVFLLVAGTFSAVAQTVTPYTIGMNYATPTTTISKVFASVQRILGNVIGSVGSSW